MIVLRFIRDILGISSIMVIVGAACFSLVGLILYVLPLPFEWTLGLGFLGGTVALGCVGAFIDSKWKIHFSRALERPVTFKRAVIAIALSLIWFVTMIVANIRVESSSRNSLGVWVGGFGILFLIFGRLEWMWNRDARVPTKRTSIRKSPNYHKSPELSNQKNI